MDSFSAFAMGEAARNAGNKIMVFDWDKAAKLIKENNPNVVGAGLESDWEWTGGRIYANGEPYMESYTFLASLWATPEIDLDGDVQPCFVMREDKPEWNANTKWPQSALDILNG